MNEQPSMMNQQLMMNPAQPTGMMGTMSQQPTPQLMNPQQSQPQPPPPQMLMNPPPQMMNRGYGMWGHPPPSQPMDLQLNYQNPNQKTQGPGGFGKLPSKHQLGPRNNWKGKKVNKIDKRKDLGRRMENHLSVGGGSGTNAGGGFNLPTMGMPGIGVGGSGFNPPSLKDLQYQNRVKTRRYFPKNHYNNNTNYNKKNMGKFAPRNTSSFIIRAKRSGGIADLVSPCPVTPSVLPTPVFSPSREVLVDMAKEEWGVDGYGSMKGLIRLRSPGGDGHDEDDEDGGSSGSDVEEHVEVERRLDHDLSRFEMIYPNYGTAGGVEYNNVLENRVDDQDSHIAQLEEENLILKERLFLMEREVGDLRRRLQSLERQSHAGDYGNEEVVENVSENESDSRGGSHSMEDNNEGLGGGSHSMEDYNEGLGEDNEDINLEFQGQEDISNPGAAKFEENNAEYGDHKEEQSSNQEVTNFEENKAEYVDHINEQDDIKDSVLESDKQNSEDGKKNGGVPVDTAVGEAPEENKDVNVQNNDIGNNNNAQDLGETGAGEDSCMHEVASDGK